MLQKLEQDILFIKRSNIVLEYLKIELVPILPQIAEATKSLKEKYENDEGEEAAKKLLKARKKL